jgi:hypothetical protein
MEILRLGMDAGQEEVECAGVIKVEEEQTEILE